MSKTKKRSRKGKNCRRWMFHEELLRVVCGGNEQRCKEMEEAMKKNPELYRIHPDCKNGTNSEQFKGLAIDEQDEASESESEEKLGISGKVSGDTERQRKIIQAFGGASGRKTAKTAEPRDEQIQDGDEPAAAARQAAEEANKKEEQLRKKAQPIERNKAFLSKIPKVICELELHIKQLSTKKVKGIVPEKYVVDFSHGMKAHRDRILTFRKDAEGIAGIKDGKQFAKKATFLEDAENEVTATLQTLKICKHTLHTYLHTGSSSSRSKS